MAFVPVYNHDVFVSYAHIDDEPLFGAQRGWVTTLINNLEIVVRQKLDLGFGLSSLGNVFVSADPAAIFERLMVYRNQPAVTEFLKKYSLLTAIDECLARRVDVFHASARIVAERATVGEHIVEPHSGAQPMHRLIVDSTELLVDELQPVIRIVETDTLRQVGDRLLEALPECAGAGETPRQVVTERCQDLRKPSANGAGTGRSIFCQTPHVEFPVPGMGEKSGAT